MFACPAPATGASARLAEPTRRRFVRETIPSVTRYDLTRMGPAQFQQLAQALLLAEFGSEIQIHGLGPDGGRDAHTRSPLHVSTSNPPWTGFTVIQIKHKEELTRRTADADWLIKELKTEVASWLKRGTKPDQLLVITNVVLTPAPGGGEEVVDNYLRSVSDELGLKAWDVWHAEKVCRLLDQHTAVRQKYLGVVVGDLLTILNEILTDDRSEMAATISGHVASAFKSERYAQLDQGGSVDDRQVPLARVFVDIPFNSEKEGDDFSKFFDESERATSVAAIVKMADLPAAPSDRALDPSRGRVIVIGGPGQGKSTLGRFICQIYRAELLDAHTHLRAQPVIDLEIRRTRMICSEEHIPQPSSLRFPVYVSLPKFANYLANAEGGSLLSFIGRKIGGDAQSAIARKWLSKYPWLVVLDGLDEVPSTANRAAMLEAVDEFQDAADACGADVVVIATSRPQGYKGEFETYKPLLLSSLTSSQALRYSKRLISIRHGEGSEKSAEILDRVEKAAGQQDTARLMTTPLQVTIVVLLLSRASRAPSQRFVLFSTYYQVIYARELEKDTPHVEVLDRFRSFIDLLHWRIGLRLQDEAGSASHTEASLSRDEMSAEVEKILVREGYEDEECESLIRRIMSAATDRLVFLVASTADNIGFELRSLQEFCAANGLLEGTDEQVHERLEAIACSDHWRNTFLLASGAIFVSNSARRDVVISICSALNAGDNPRFQGSNAVLMGSRLALDLLRDGVADTALRHQRLLADLAVAVMNTAASDAIHNLAQIHFTDATANDKVVRAVSRGLNSPDINELFASLTVLCVKFENGDRTALVSVRSCLTRIDGDTQVELLRLASGVTRDVVLRRLLLEKVVDWSPEKARPLLTRAVVSPPTMVDSNWPQELSPGATMITRLIGRVQTRAAIAGEDPPKHLLRVIPIRGPGRNTAIYRTAAIAASLAGDLGRWEFLRQSLIFGNAPSVESWQQATAALGQAARGDVSAWWSTLPWPLALWWERQRPELTVSPAVISAWQQQQSLWAKSEIHDVFKTPLEISPQVSGIPAVAVTSTVREVPRNTILELANNLAQMPKDRFRDALVSWWWQTLARSPERLSVLRDLPYETCATLALHPGSISADMIIEAAASQTSDLLHKADVVGRHATQMTVVIRGQVRIQGAYLAWQSDPALWGIARAMMRSQHATVNQSWRDVSTLGDDPIDLYRKLVVVWGGTWDEQDIVPMVHFLIENADHSTVPIGFFRKFNDGPSGAELVRILHQAHDDRWTSVTNALVSSYANAAVELPERTFGSASVRREASN